MAKTAVLIVIFALVAVCSSARIPREAPAQTLEVPKTIEEFQNSVQNFFKNSNISEQVSNAFSDENIAKFRKFAEDFGTRGKAFLDNTVEQIQAQVAANKS